jgi:hypothetical protein
MGDRPQHAPWMRCARLDLAALSQSCMHVIPTGIPDSSPRILKTYVRYDATVGYSDAYERA